MDGKMLNFYPNGDVHNEMYYIKGVPNGIYKTYNEDGSLAVEVKFENGKAVSGHAVIQEHQMDLTPEDLAEMSQSKQPF